MSSIRHSDIYSFFTRLLPEESLVYHSPLPPHREYDALRTKFTAKRIILSLTPTEGVYSALNTNQDRNEKSIVVLHRPFRLDRRRVPHGTLVLQSHIRYDELLTTGWNPSFADEHGISTDQSERVCIKGYKDDPERKIGLVGKLCGSNLSKSMSAYAQEISEAFHGHDALELSAKNESGKVGILASLNAFTPEVLDRVSSTVRDLGIKNDQVLCLTGAIREIGMEEARKLGFSVIAVGHKRCEDWGMEYIERLLRKEFVDANIERIDEPEEVQEKHPKQKDQNQAATGGKQNGANKNHRSTTHQHQHQPSSSPRQQERNPRTNNQNPSSQQQQRDSGRQAFDDAVSSAGQNLWSQKVQNKS